VRLVALVDAPDHVCCRYRLAAFRPHLEAAGHTLELRTRPRRWWGFVRLLRELHSATVIVQRYLFAAWQVALLRRAAGCLLFDLDDAVFLRDSYSRGLHHPRRLARFAAIVRACDAVIAGNAFLAASAARYTDDRCIHVVPSCVDPSHYTPTPSGRAGSIDLVWVGSSSTLQGLEQIAPLLDEVGRALPGIRLKVICDRFPCFRHLDVVPCPWSAATEAAEIASADLGITWIPDDLWSRGKCGLKVLQYLAAGLPVVANPVGVHPEMVRPGRTGFLATTPAEWVDAVRRLALDPALRHRLGAAGRRLVISEYSVEAGAARWLEVLARLERPMARSA
jgi:glycosyltransferase involved in cell wall biosynthesis